MKLEPAAAAVATIDPILSLLVGALGAAMLGLLGAWIQSRREHERWVREERMGCYREFLAATELTWPSQSTDRSDWRAHMDAMAVALGKVRIVGPDSVANAANFHLNAVLDVSSAQRKFNDVDGAGVIKPGLEGAFHQAALRAEGTRNSFVDSARKPLKIRGK